MKRFVLSIIIFCLMLGVSIFCSYKSYRTEQYIKAEIEQIRSLDFENDKDRLVRKTEELRDYWQETEPKLTLFIRNDFTLPLGSSIVRLPALAKEDMRGEFYTELDSIDWYIHYVIDPEIITMEEVFSLTCIIGARK